MPAAYRTRINRNTKATALIAVTFHKIKHKYVLRVLKQYFKHDKLFSNLHRYRQIGTQYRVLLRVVKRLIINTNLYKQNTAKPTYILR